MSSDHNFSSTKPIFASVAVSAGAYLVVLLLRPQLNQPQPVPVPLLNAQNDLIPRVLAGSCIIALLVSMTAVMFFSIGIIRRHAIDNKIRWIQKTWILSIIAFVVTLAASVVDSYWGLTHSWIAVQKLPTRIRADYFFHTLNACGGVPTAFVVSAAAAAVSGLNNAVSSKNLNDLRSRIHDVRLLLYGISLTLVIAVIELYAVFHWASVNFNPEWSTYASTLGVAIPSALGVLYTIFLAALFGPIMLDQRRAVEEVSLKLCDKKFTYQKRCRWMQRQGLRSQWSQNISETLAVLGPFLTGTVLPALWVWIFN